MNSLTSTLMTATTTTTIFTITSTIGTTNSSYQELLSKSMQYYKFECINILFSGSTTIGIGVGFRVGILFVVVITGISRNTMRRGKLTLLQLFVWFHGKKEKIRYQVVLSASGDHVPLNNISSDSTICCHSYIVFYL